jgi:hypothetical protein
MKAILIKREDGYNLGIEQPQGRLLEATCSPSQQLILNKSGASTKYKLSKQNCDEIFGVIDSFYESISKLNTSYLKGFNKAMELNKDKQFTLEDLENFRKFQIQEQNFSKSCLNVWLQSRQQPKEIEVEIEMEDVIQLNKRAGGTTNMGKPKLDEDGCLILKKV